MSLSRKRIEWIDYARGYATILVIFSHLIIGKIGSFIVSFTLPLFFFLSGFLFNKNISFITLLKKRIRTLIIPYFFLGLPVIVSYAFLYKFTSLEDIYYLILDFVFQQKFLNIWFITCLFMLEIIFYYISNTVYSNSDTFIISISILSVFLGSFYYRTINVPLYWNVDTSLMALPFFSLGYISRKNNFYDYINSNIFNNKIISLTCSVLLLIVSFLLWNLGYKHGKVMNMFYNEYGYIPISYLSALFGIVFLIFFANISKIKSVEYIGKNSMIFYVLHQFVIFPIVNYICSIINIESIFSALFNNCSYSFILITICALKTVITCFLIGLINEAIIRMKLSFFLGK